MKTLFAFVKKELLETVRTGRLCILLAVFLLLGAMNPAIAKLTPWMMELMSDALAASGMDITISTVSAADSWMQFFKNLPIGLIVFLVFASSAFPREYQSGTLITALTRGLARWKILAAKAVVQMLLWTACYWLCYGVTAGANAGLWPEQSIPLTLILHWYLAGLWLIAALVLWSVILRSTIGVLLGTGGTYLACYLLGLFPALAAYLPTTLMSGGDWRTVLLASITGLLALTAAVPIFRKKQL